MVQTNFLCNGTFFRMEEVYDTIRNYTTMPYDNRI